MGASGTVWVEYRVCDLDFIPVREPGIRTIGVQVDAALENCHIVIEPDQALATPDSQIFELFDEVLVVRSQSEYPGAGRTDVYSGLGLF